VAPLPARSLRATFLEKVGALVGEMRAANPELVAYTFLNRADPRGPDNEEAAAALQDTAELRFLDTPLGARKAFSNATAQGTAVTELKLPDPKACDDDDVI
jgi:chromosome partitioning protein